MPVSLLSMSLSLSLYVFLSFAQLVSFICLEHMMLVLKMVLIFMLDDVPKWVRQNVQRQVCERAKRDREADRSDEPS